jgi:uncharacterized damage-inducible protein DinB
VLEPPDQTGEPGAATETSDVQLPQTHPGIVSDLDYPNPATMTAIAAASGLHQPVPDRIANNRYGLGVMSLIDILLPEYDREVGTTRALIATAPDADLGWRPVSSARTLGQLVTHLAEIPAWTAIVMTSDRYDLEALVEPSPEHGVTATLLRFDTHAAAGRDALAGRLDEALTADWMLERHGVLVFALPRISTFRVLVLNHLIHHRGQLSVYLRMRGVALPPIYGPVR